MIPRFLLSSLLLTVLGVGPLAGPLRGQSAAPAIPDPGSPTNSPAPADPAPPAPAPAPAPPPVAPEVQPIAPPPAPPAPAESPAPAPTAKAVPAAPAKPRFSIPEPGPRNPVDDFIGHRYIEPQIDSGGWGWVKLPKDSWHRAHWVVLQETPGVAAAPYRAMGSRDADQNYEYKMRGYIAPYQAYDPHTDEMLDVFVLVSAEPIGTGPAEALGIRSGPDSRKSHVHSTFSSRPKHSDDDY